MKRHARESLFSQDIEAISDRSEIRDIGKLQLARPAGLQYEHDARVLDAITIVSYSVAKLTQKEIANF